MPFHICSNGYTGVKPAPKTMNSDLLAALIALVTEYGKPEQATTEDKDVPDEAVNANALRPRGFIFTQEPAKQAKPKAQTAPTDGLLVPRRVIK